MKCQEKDQGDCDETDDGNPKWRLHKLFRKLEGIVEYVSEIIKRGYIKQE